MDADSLRIITRALSAKLRSDPSFSESFITNNAEDLVAQGVLEYERKRRAGEEVLNPGGLVVHSAYRRAVDRLRAEGRELHGEAAEKALASAADPHASTDSLALGRIEAQRLHEAIGTLTEAQRQALSALYFDEEPVRAAAAALGTTRSTLCRRRDEAIAVLRERFAVPDQIQPGDSFALEIGLAAHLSLAVVAASKLAILAPLGASVGRVRDFFARLFLSGGGGGVGGAATASIPKAIGIGICGASTVAVCTVVAVGPGLGLLGSGGDNSQAREPAAVRQIAQPAASAAAPAPRSAADRHATRTARRHHRRQKKRASLRRAREKAARESASSLGIGSAAPEPPVEPPPSTPSEPSSGSGPSPDEIANEQFAP